MEDILTFMESQFEVLDQNPITLKSSVFEQRGVERLVHILVESFLDVGNQMIDGFIMRDPGSYEDIVAILVDESVLTKDEQPAYLELVSLRKQLVQNYSELTLDQLKGPVDSYLSVWRQFPSKVRAYLMSELGPVSAFKPENERG